MKNRHLIVSSLIFIVLIAFHKTVWAAELTKLRIGQSAEKTRLVFEIKNNHRFEISRLTKPARIVVDFYKTQNNLSFDHKKILDKRLKAIRVDENGQRVRVVFDLKDDYDHHYFTLAKNKRGAERIVVDLTNRLLEDKTTRITQIEKPRKPVTKPQKTVVAKSNKLQEKVVQAKLDSSSQVFLKKKKELVVAIDAGHGGKDTGAIGTNNTYEKDVTLALAKKLKQLIDRQPGMKGVLTRDKDEFIPLHERVRLAHRQQADIFISIHADSFPSQKVQGGSVYVLSTQGASSVMARILARSENASLQDVKLQGRDSDVAFVLSDMTREANIRASRKLGKLVLSEMGNAVELHKDTVQSADFAVLKSIDMPSLLIETAFISNPTEEKRLKDRVFQTKMAQSIVAGLSKFVERNASQPHWGEKLYVHYRVQSGDTLSEIAMNYGISVDELKKLNGIRKADRLYIGKRLKIPVSEKVVASL